MDHLPNPSFLWIPFMDHLSNPYFLLTINQFELPTIYQMIRYYQLVKPIELPIGKNIVQG